MRPEHRCPADSEQLQVVEQHLVVMELLVHVLVQVGRERPRQRGQSSGNARACLAAASVRGTVARMIPCWRIRNSGHNSRSRGWFMRAVHAAL